MAIVYTKKEQGVTVYMCNSAPIHTATVGDKATDNSTGNVYTYSTQWDSLNQPPVYDGEVSFDKLTPTTVGVIFEPNTPQLEDVLYYSSLDGSTWVWNGASYVTKSSSNFNFAGTVNDAGSNKGSAIERPASIATGEDSTFNTVSVGKGGGNMASNTRVGNNSLLSNTTGVQNTAVGFDSLRNNTTGMNNAAVGLHSLGNNTIGMNNAAVGMDALFLNVSGGGNTAVGSQALYNSLVSNTTAVGFQALRANTTGTQNTATGSNALLANTTGNHNTATGSNALQDNTSGDRNASFGALTLFTNSTGNDNTAVGYRTLSANTTGGNNTGVGSDTLRDNQVGGGLTAVGYNALTLNTTGSYNTAVGTQALYNNTTGMLNSAFGHSAMYNNLTGASNSALGVNTLYNNTSGSNSTAVGYEALMTTTVGNGTAVGYHALRLNSTGTNSTAFGNNALRSNSTGNYNTATGSNAMYSNTTGGSAAAFGNSAMYLNTTGEANSAFGEGALLNNSTGSENTAVGIRALAATGTSNGTAVGSQAMANNTSGANNTAIGKDAMRSSTTGGNNTAVGFAAGYRTTGGLSNTTSTNSVFLGADTKSFSATDTNQIVIGFNAIGAGSNSVTIGNNLILNTFLRGAVRINGVYTLPIIDGTVGQVPTTNGAGVVTWEDAGANPSVQTVVSSATVTPTSSDDLVEVTAQAGALVIANPTGTYVNGQNFLIRVTDDGTIRAITYGAKFRTIGNALPTSTVAGEPTLIGCTYNSEDDKFDSVGNAGTGGGGSSDVAFSPQDVADADQAPTAASTQYYYQTVSTVTGTINNAKMWGYSGTDTLLFAIYRGSFGSLTLLGQGSITATTGANVIPLTAEVGQNLNLVVGEDIVIGFYADGTSWRTVYDTGIPDETFALINTANIATMPATPSGTGTPVRFACTLYS